jgi:signal transduction histidine kinase
MSADAPVAADGTVMLPATTSTSDLTMPGASFRQAAPFIGAIAIGLLLLPLQSVPVDGVNLALAIVSLVAILTAGVALDARPSTPRWAVRSLVIPFLLAVWLLRDATGGTLSGYGVFFYLAPFWTALTDTRRQVYFVISAMFVVQSLSGLVEVNFDNFLALRRAIFAAVVIGLISLAVQRTLERVRAAETRLASEAAEREQLNHELERSNGRLERSNRELEQFAYVSSHDLQEPLRMIRSFTQLLQQRHANQLDDEAKELLEFVLDGAERAQQLVNDLLEYSRVETGGRAFDEVNLDASLDRALATLQGRIDDSEAVVERLGPLPTVHGDAGQLDRLFVNLIGNALKYRSPQRSPVVRIASAPVVTPAGVRVTISDNGIGFDPRHGDRIFRMFQRLHGRTEYEGTGIGLSICARIVERHGGAISAQGALDEGAAFTFTLEDATE